MRLFDYRTILSVALLLIIGCSKTTDVDLPITSTSEEAKELYNKAWYYWDQSEGMKGWGLMEEALSLDQSIEFIAEDELLEVTPQSIRLRKMELDQVKRLSLRKKEKYSSA